MYKALKEIMDENPGQVHPKTTYKTGFKELDQIIQGFTSTDLVLIAAKPGNCGNIFLKNLGVRMSNDIPVLFINTEKDAFTYAKDLESIVTSVPENSGLDEMQGPTSDIFIESDAKFPKEIDKTIGQFKREHPDEAIVLIDNMNGVFFSQEAGNYTYEKQAFEISGGLAPY